MKGKIISRQYGELPDGKEVVAVTIVNDSGAQLEVINYGGIITELMVPNKQGDLVDVVLGYDNLESYVEDPFYMGALVGRYANRIANGKFKLGNEEYQLPMNNGNNCLHGGPIGFNKVLWDIEPFTKDDVVGVILKYVSKDGEMGFPGNLSCTVTYSLDSKNSVRMDYTAVTDKTTVINLTQHSYFNLNQSDLGIADHELKLDADHFLPINLNSIPTGEIRPVIRTPFDFTKSKKIGLSINNKDEQLIKGNGYDHCWILNEVNDYVKPVGILFSPTSGIRMEVLTTEPAVQLYTGNFLDGSISGKNGATYSARKGVCLETQKYPDSPNHPEFPTSVLKSSETYRSTTIYRFT